MSYYSALSPTGVCYFLRMIYCLWCCDYFLLKVCFKNTRIAFFVRNLNIWSIGICPVFEPSAPSSSGLTKAQLQEIIFPDCCLVVSWSWQFLLYSVWWWLLFFWLHRCKQNGIMIKFDRTAQKFSSIFFISKQVGFYVFIFKYVIFFCTPIW